MALPTRNCTPFNLAGESPPLRRNVHRQENEPPFDGIIDHRGTESLKWTLYDEDVLPM